jgi:hypothetical protein
LVSHIEGEHRLRVFENRVLRKIFGSKRDEVTGECEDCIMRSFMIFISTKHYLDQQIEENGMWGVGARGT